MFQTDSIALRMIFDVNWGFIRSRRHARLGDRRHLVTLTTRAGASRARPFDLSIERTRQCRTDGHEDRKPRRSACSAQSKAEQERRANAEKLRRRAARRARRKRARILRARHAGRPTPTQRECDLLQARRARIDDYENDGGEPETRTSPARSWKAALPAEQPLRDAGARARAVQRAAPRRGPGRPRGTKPSTPNEPADAHRIGPRHRRKATEGQYRPGPYHLPITGGWLPGRCAV